MTLVYEGIWVFEGYEVTWVFEGYEGILVYEGTLVYEGILVTVVIWGFVVT